MTVRYKRCLISELKPGMMLGTDVLSARGKVMLSANTVLTENKIRRLSLWGYDSVIVLVDDAVGNQLREKALSERMIFSAKYEQTVVLVRKAFDEIRYFKEVPLKKMQDLSDNALVSLAATPGVLGYLHSLRSLDDYTFQHSVNVAII